SAPSSRTRVAISAAEKWISPIRSSPGKWPDLAGEVEVEMLGEALEIAPVEELDLDAGVPLAELAQLPVLSGDERLLHGGDLDVEVLLGEVEVGREGLGHAPGLVLFEHKRPGLVFPRDVVIVEHLRALELRGARKPRRFSAAVRLKDRELELHRRSRYRADRTPKQSAQAWCCVFGCAVVIDNRLPWRACR